MTHEAYIAANRVFNSISNLQVVPYERLASLFRENLLILRKKDCHCEDKNEKIVKIPNIYPLYPTEGSASKGLYSSLPYAYISKYTPSNALPIIEVIETPIPYSKMLFYSKDKDEIDKIISPHGKSIVGSYKKVTIPIINEEISLIRKRALLKILEVSNKNALIYLSIFRDMPKILVGDGFSRYQQGFEVSQNKTGWEYQSERIMPILFQKKLYVYFLDCWVLTKKDLNI